MAIDGRAAIVGHTLTVKELRDQDLMRHDEERIDEALAESFPASDPPWWTLGVDPPSRS